jgi:peptidylprolyl isomerase
MSRAKHGDTVRVKFTGKLDDGEIFDSSDESGLLEFKVGDDEIIPGLEDAVLGMVPGEQRTVTIPADRAYGPHISSRVHQFGRKQFSSHVIPEIGKVLQIRQCQGIVRAKVVAVSESNVTIDMNHPLAGRDLIFDLQLVEIA